MKKVLIIYNKLWPYRIPIFNILNKKYDLTVTHSIDKAFNTDTEFDVKHLSGFRLSRFFIHKKSLHKLSKNYDVVVGYGDISWLSIMSLLFRRNRKYKVILWGIGVRASYNTEYGEKTKWDKLRYYFMRKADAVLFYSKNPIPLYLKEGFKESQLFVANNTVLVNRIDETLTRETLLFIGTLYKQKQIYALLDNYLFAFKKNNQIPNLEIIGGGDEYDNIKEWIKRNALTDKVFLRGKIFNEEKLCNYFSKAIACISPGQAGLSVLKSMGYGVPYITKENAITGGEIFNIENGVSGILYKNNDELTNIILDISNNKSKYVEMGVEAKKHYDLYRKPTDMANGIIEAVEWVSKK